MDDVLILCEPSAGNAVYDHVLVSSIELFFSCEINSEFYQLKLVVLLDIEWKLIGHYEHAIVVFLIPRVQSDCNFHVYDTDDG